MAILEAKITNKNNEIFDIHMIFSIIESNQIEASASITDHYVEDNTARQDHMSLAPLKYTLSGLVAEKVYQRKYEVITKIIESSEKIGDIANVYVPDAAKRTLQQDLSSGFALLVPQVSNYAATAIGAYNYVESRYKQYANSIQTVKGIFNKNKVKLNTQNQKNNPTYTLTKAVLPTKEIEPINQEDAFQTLDSLRVERAFINLKNTPFGDFFGQKFLIESIKMDQGDTKSMSRLTVTVKEYRGVSTKTVKIDAEQYAGRTATNKAITENLGKAKGKEDVESTLYKTAYGTWGK
jgi:hypothetical protein